MAIRNPIYSGIKVRNLVVRAIRKAVKEGYYRVSPAERGLLLENLSVEISQIYNITKPSLKVDSTDNNHYGHMRQEIVLDKPSIMSFLHEYRHHLQHTLDLKYKRMTVEQDARAWSMRIFNNACPKMFEKAVKAGKVFHVTWDEAQGKVVDHARYI